METFSRKFVQRLVYEDLGETPKLLPFVDELRALHKCDCHFPLVFDPLIEKLAVIVGMFVVRPAYVAASGTLISGLNLVEFDDNDNSTEKQFAALNNNKNNKDSILSGRSWVYNYKGLDGGWFVANKNILDAYRVALQYGLSDAVIIGTRTVAIEGIDRNSSQGQLRGYLWQPYAPTEWPHLKAACPNLLEMIMRQRSSLQNQGCVSARKYPAQIVFTFSGKSHVSWNSETDSQEDDVWDFLEARIFTAMHPDGEPIECYIMTGARGAARIRERVRSSFPHLVSRIDGMLIVLPLVSIFVVSVVYEVHNLAPVGQFFPEPRFPNIKSSS